MYTASILLVRNVAQIEVYVRYLAKGHKVRSAYVSRET